jgi:hypothetical protein
MREARKTLAVAGAALMAGCGGGGTPSNVVTLTPTPGVGITSVMECLGQEATNAGYKIIRADREGGYMLAERRDRDPNIVQPREYAGGDRIEVNGVKQDKAIRAVTLKPSSFIMEWLANGANEKHVATSDRVKGDAASFSEKCKL